MSEDHDSTPISELDESASLNANDEFIISTKDSNEVYSSKKVKLSTVQNASPAAGITVKEEGATLATDATSLNFVGSTVTATGTGAEKTITITEPAGIQGITVKEEGTTLATDATSLNFVGSTVTASGTGAEKTITIAEPAGGGGASAYHIIQTSASFYVGGGDVRYAGNTLTTPGLINGNTTPPSDISYVDILIALGYIEPTQTLTTGPRFQIGAGNLAAYQVQGYKITSLGAGPSVDSRTGVVPHVCVMAAGAVNTSQVPVVVHNSWSILEQANDEGVFPYLSTWGYSGGSYRAPRAFHNAELLVYLNLI